MNIAIGEELKVLRIRKKLTLEKASESIGIDLSTLSRYEKAATPITVEMLERLLDFYEEDIIIFFNNVRANMHR